MATASGVYHRHVLNTPVALHTALLWVILILAGTLRFWGLDFGMPFIAARPDEGQVVGTAAGLVSAGTLNPHFFAYPSLFLYALGAVYATVCGAGAAVHAYPTLQACLEADAQLILDRAGCDGADRHRGGGGDIRRRAAASSPRRTPGCAAARRRVPPRARVALCRHRRSDDDHAPPGSRAAAPRGRAADSRSFRNRRARCRTRDRHQVQRRDTRGRRRGQPESARGSIVARDRPTRRLG